VGQEYDNETTCTALLVIVSLLLVVVVVSSSLTQSCHTVSDCMPSRAIITVSLFRSQTKFIIIIVYFKMGSLLCIVVTIYLCVCVCVCVCVYFAIENI